MCGVSSKFGYKVSASILQNLLHTSKVELEQAIKDKISCIRILPQLLSPFSPGTLLHCQNFVANEGAAGLSFYIFSFLLLIIGFRLILSSFSMNIRSCRYSKYSFLMRVPDSIFML